MHHEETTNKTNFDEKINDKMQENLNSEDLAGQIVSEEVDNLPIESIGSYGRIEPIMNDETEYPEEGDVDRQRFLVVLEIEIDRYKSYLPAVTYRIIISSCL